MLKKMTLITSVLATSMLVGCSSDNENNDETGSVDTAAVLESFPAAGVFLSYDVLRSDLIDAKTLRPFEVRNGGFGSAMTAHPSNPTRFYTLTDRGPNAGFTGDYGKGKKFPSPDYTPRIGLFEVMENGQINHVSTILLKDLDGNNISGLPNSAALGGTGETPYYDNGDPILIDDTKPYNETTNPFKLDDYGLDGEGLVALSDGTFWVSDEYGPHLVHYDADGVEIDRINAYADDPRTSINLPAEFANRRANRGMEGLAITPDEKTLVGIMQSTMYNPNSSVKDLDITRIVTVNLETKEVGQYLYKQEKTQNSNSEIAALSDTKFLVIERDGSFLNGGPGGASAATPNAQKHVYRIDLSNATNLEEMTSTGHIEQDNALGLTIDSKTLEEVVLADGGWASLTAAGIVPAEKKLIVDMVAAVGFPHDKMEGLWVIDDSHLGILNDDDFATWSTGGELEQKMLDINTIDGSRLYIIDGLDLSSN
ncbi:esterase-like activity of phytase family protein [Marinobacter sp. KMM 10035]|uniref:esterase-like activity of phytase family protein n=1 Tax=Marinobacter sp. KMM 10035 TaxID=3134034 RepID=UPI00397B20A5